MDASWVRLHPPRLGDQSSIQYLGVGKNGKTHVLLGYYLCLHRRFLRIIKNAPNVCFVKEHTIFHSWQMLGEQNGEGRGCYYRFFRLRQSLVPKCGEDDPGETRMESQITQEFSYKQ